MAGEKQALPKRVTLPSGTRVILSEAKLRAAAAEPSQSAPIARAFDVLAAEGAVRHAEGAELTFGELPLRDAHLLRALLLRSRIVVEKQRTVRCSNCGEQLTIVPSEAFEPGPFVDGELDDPELDAPFDFGRAHDIPPVLTGAGTASTIRLAPRTVDEASLLARAGGGLAPSRAVVAALGVKELGPARTAQAIARGLAAASDDAFAEVLAIWEDAHYAPRMVADVVCSCGARNDYPVPGDRELDALASVVEPEGDDAVPDGFPSEATFAAWARAAQDRVFERRGVRNIDVIVDYDVPECDDGGVPMLGCYTPPGEGGGVVGLGPEVRLFYRSFLDEKKADPTFDVAGEIEETVDHEIEHHLNFLRGEDPLDDEERAVIAQERARVVGRRELVRRSGGGWRAELGWFMRLGFPLFALLLALAIWRSCAP